MDCLLVVLGISGRIMSDGLPCDRDEPFRKVCVLFNVISKSCDQIFDIWDQIDIPPFDYPTYLQSPEWKARRDERVKAAGNRCQVCNRAEKLNVHHRTYERIGNEIPDDLIVLCEPCHKLFHDNGRLARP
jgi:hypothetical protein